MIEAIYGFDLSMFAAFDSLRAALGGAAAFVDRAMKAVTHLGDAGMVWIALALALLIFRRTRPCGAALAAALIGCLLLNNLLLKNLIARPRPFVRYEHIAALISPPGDSSFPSGHSASAFAGATALLLTLRRPHPYGAALGRTAYACASAAAFVLAALTAASRIWLHVHYFTDVLAGMFTGALCAFAGAYLARRLFGWIYKRAARGQSSAG